MKARGKGRIARRGNLVFVLAVALAPVMVSGKAKEVDDHHWEGVERIVVLGDVHGDYDQYMKVLEDAGLVDRRGRWDGGETHFVQTGDIPDRGPDTRKIMDHLEKLQKEAQRKGGRVHTLIGNHDAMNVYGDLRYVTAGEYAAFVGRDSERYREAQWEHHVKTLEQRDPEAFAELDLEAFRKEWEQDYPLGWVEHRQAWQASGPYGEQVMDNPVVLKVNDTLFLHGGLSAKYCELSLEAITERAHDEIANYDYADPGMIEDEYGPLWYRGLAQDNELLRGPMVDAILERYEARRIVVGHTPTQGVVWPRFDGRVVLNDVGLAAYYGSNFAWLEIKGDEAIAHYGEGRSLPLPADNAGRLEYLGQVVAWNPGNTYLQSRLEKLQQAPEPSLPAPPDPDSLGEEERAELARKEAWLSPDNCR